MLQNKTPIRPGKNRVAPRSPHKEISDSRTVQEILSVRPGSLVRYGTAIIAALLLLLAGGASLIRYPDVLPGALVLTTDPLPVSLTCESGGRVQQLFAAEGDVVESGMPVAELQNNTGYANTLLLTELADTVLGAIRRDDESALRAALATDYNSLGDAQPAYNGLIDAVSAWLLTRGQHAGERRGRTLQNQNSSYRTLSGISAREEGMIREALVQADEQFKANEALYKDRIISRMEYYAEAEKLRQKKLLLEGQRRAGLQNSIAISGNNKELLDLALAQEERETGQMQAVREAVRNLQNFVAGWRLRYLLFSPFAGRVHFGRPLQVNQALSAGEAVCVVVPLRYRYTAHLTLPAGGSGKAAPGQEAQLMLDQFPAAEFGYLRGTVQDIAPLPRKGTEGVTYSITVALSDTLRTSYGRTLPFHAEMTGTARIITRDRSLLQRALSVLMPD